MTKHWLIYGLQVITFIVMIYINYLASALPINGYTTGDVSDLLSNKIVPAGFTFAVWGFIYLCLLGYLIFYGMVLSKKNEPIVHQFESIASWFIISNIINSVWIVAWHYIQPGIALVLMILLFLCLLQIFLLTQRKIQMSLWPKLAFEGYFGWINVALVANTAAFLTHIDWNGFGISFDKIAIIILLVLIVIGTMTSLKFGAIIYAFVLAWAMFGIYSNIENNTQDQALIFIPLMGFITFLFIGTFNSMKDVLKLSNG